MPGSVDTHETVRPMLTSDTHPSSFRDPSGFLFWRDGTLYRQINQPYADDYRLLTESGLYDKLVAADLLIPHEEVDVEPARREGAHKVLKPERLDFISYPYEWCFSQLREAALTTLRIAATALEHGMVLKDASAYNIQFRRGRAIFIDTLSFEQYREGEPWVAYRQFCQHFLAPLALASYTDIRLTQLLRVHIDGLPLDLAAKLLPLRARFRFSLLSHIFLHARSQKRFAGTTAPTSRLSVSKRALLGILDSLTGAATRLRWALPKTEWGAYYEDTNYSEKAFEHKRQQVAGMIERVGPDRVWDLGANTGEFSRLASDRGIPTVAFDVDPVAVEKSYAQARDRGEERILPLQLDLTNPSPAIGWSNEERSSLVERGPVDLAMALALVHHLAIGNNVPLVMVAAWLARVCRHLIIEFVPKEDSQVQRLLATREDVFPDYTEAGFERAFATQFDTEEKTALDEGQRTLYLMRRK